MIDRFENKVVFDIETIPAQDEKVILSREFEFKKNFKVSKSLSKIEMGRCMDMTDAEIKRATKEELMLVSRRFIADKAYDEFYRKTSLDGGIGEIVSISWMSLKDENTYCLTRSLDEPESKIIKEFDNSIEGDVYFIGHNISGFDLKFLWKRYIVNKIRPSFKININGRHESDFYDTMTGWGGYGYGDSSGKSLEFICDALGIEKNKEINGSHVWDLAKEGRQGEIAMHNINDVEATFELYKRLTFNI